MRAKTTGHIFAGAGGGILGDLILGHKPLFAVEWDKYACAVLRERVNDGWFEGMRVHETDARLFDPSEYAGRVDCIHAGFPCQDISVAGKQAGVGEETRSGLYREVLRIADVVRPRELFMENVSAILSNGLGTVLSDLSTRGYVARWICLRASDVGANHHRDRWWLLAKRRETGLANTDRQLCGTSWTGEMETAPAITADAASEQSSSSSENGNVCNTEHGSVFPNPSSIRQQGSRTHEQSVNHSAAGNREADRSINIREAGQSIRKSESSMGGLDDGLANESYVDWWESEPNIGRVTGVSKDRAAQLRCLGNGQVPLQAAVAYQMLERLF